MKIAEIEKCLIDWRDNQQALAVAYDALHDLVGALPDSKLMTPAFKLCDAYTKAVGEVVGDDSGWLDWYQYECKFGARPKLAILASGKKITVKTLRQLARIIDGEPPPFPLI